MFLMSPYVNWRGAFQFQTSYFKHHRLVIYLAVFDMC